jgi:hypothetical protein
MSSDIGRIGLIGHKQELLGKVGAVLGGLRRMQAQSDEAAKAMANCWDYLNAHRGRTYYRQLRRGGYPLGRGGIESSNKFMVMSGSSALVRGGMRSTAITCWHCAVPSITVPWIRCLDGTESGYGKCQNDRMLPYTMRQPLQHSWHNDLAQVSGREKIIKQRKTRFLLRSIQNDQLLRGVSGVAANVHSILEIERGI